MVGKPQKRTLQTRQAIMDIAAKMFDSKGFENTSVEEIAEQAEVAKATIFSHFGDKISLLIAVKIKYTQQLLKQQVKLKPYKTYQSPTKIMFNLYQPWLKLFRDNPDFVQLFLVQSTLKNGPWSEQFVEVCGNFNNIIIANIIEMKTHNIISETTDIDLTTQAVQAFYYHVLAMYKGGYIKTANQQETLFKNLIEQWFKNN